MRIPSELIRRVFTGGCLCPDDEGGYEDQIMDVQTAKDASGNVLGYVITVTAKDASQAPITFSVGIQ